MSPRLKPVGRATKVLVVTPDVLGAKMAGPAIRAWEIAKAVHRIAEARLVSTQASTLNHEAFPVEFATEAELRRHVSWADIIVFQGHILSSYPWIADSGIIIVADIYDPMHLETLEQGRYLSAEKRAYYTLDTIEVLNRQIEQADFMLCASEKQRDFWLGQLGALGRINPLTYDADPSLRNLLDVAPFGVSNAQALQTRHAIKGSLPGIAPDDEVIIWGGGIYNWFDPLTLIRAVAKLAPRHPKLRLFFLGAQHPNPNVPAMRMVSDARRLSDELGLSGTRVFFNDEWVAYEDRINYLLDADLGVSTHFEHVETAFSFRTRILDYLWAGLPIVTTDGDTFADIVREHGLGGVVAPEDVDDLSETIENLLYGSDNTEYRSRVAGFAETMTWDRTLRALLDFCAAPHHAADHSDPQLTPSANELRVLRARVHELEGSFSWRATKPFREITSRFRKGR